MLIDVLTTYTPESSRQWLYGDAQASMAAQTVFRCAPGEEAHTVVWAPKEDLGIGRAAALNECLRDTRGDAFMLLDADDTLWPECIERLANTLHGQPRDVVAVYAGCQMMDENGKPLSERPLNGFDAHWALQAGMLQPIAFHPVLYRRSAVDEVGGFDERMTACVDFDLTYRLMAAGGRFLRVPGVLYNYRRHPGQMTARRAEQMEAALQVVGAKPKGAKRGGTQIRDALRAEPVARRKEQNGGSLQAAGLLRGDNGAHGSRTWDGSLGGGQGREGI